MASEMPVLPEVGSRIVCPGRIRPFSSASSIIARATRSLTEPVGLRDSSLAQSRTPGFGLRRFSSTSGVWPIAWMMSPYRPPQGLFSRRSAAIASGSVARRARPLGGPASDALARQYPIGYGFGLGFELLGWFVLADVEPDAVTTCQVPPKATT